MTSAIKVVLLVQLCKAWVLLGGKKKDLWRQKAIELKCEGGPLKGLSKNSDTAISCALEDKCCNTNDNNYTKNIHQ